MTRQSKFLVFSITFLLFVGACSLFQPPGEVQAPTITPVSTDTIETPQFNKSTDTPVSIPTQTATITSSPSPTAIQTGPFHGVSSMTDLLPDPASKVQVRPLADGSAWIITNREVLWWDGKAWEVILFEDEDFLAAVDEDGQLWVLRQDRGEIAGWRDGQWTRYDKNSGWMDAITFEPSWWAPSPWSVVRGAANSRWLPMGFNIRSFDGNSWSVHKLEEMDFLPPEWEEMEVIHRNAIRDGGSEVWVGECYYSGPGPMGGLGVRWFDGETWHGADAPVGSKCVSVIEVDSTDKVWLGSLRDIWSYDPFSQEWTTYHMPEALLAGFNFTHPLQLIIDGSGDAWVIMQMCGGASCDGPANLYWIHEGEWSLIAESEYWSDPLKQLAMDGSGQIWLFWDGAVYRLAGETMEPVTSLVAQGAGASPDGRIWVVADFEGIPPSGALNARA